MPRLTYRSHTGYRSHTYYEGVAPGAVTFVSSSDVWDMYGNSSVNQPPGGATIFASDRWNTYELAGTAGTIPPAPIIDDLEMPDYDIRVHFAGTSAPFLGVNATRTLLTGQESYYGSYAYCDQVEFNDTMPGGFDSATFRIDYAEYDARRSTYHFGAVVTIRIALGQPNAGAVVFQGYLRTPVVSSENIVTMEVKGFMSLAEEHDEELLFTDCSFQSWQDTGSDPWDSAFSTGSGIDSSISTGALKFSVAKGTKILNGWTERIGWWFDGHEVNKIDAELHCTPVEDGPGSPLFALKIEKFDAPDAYGSKSNVDTLTGLLNSGGTSSFSRTVGGGGSPAVTFTLEALKNAGGAGSTSGDKWVVQLKKLVVYELSNNFSFTAWQCLNVVAGFGAIGTTGTSGLDLKMGAMTTSTLPDGSGIPSLMPLWWQNGTWREFMEFLGTSMAFKVAVWEGDVVDASDQEGSPQMEFRPWGTAAGGRRWHVFAYDGHGQYTHDDTTRRGPSTIPPAVVVNPHAIPDLTPSDDVFSFVEVSFSIAGSPRLRRARSPVLNDDGNNPLAGLPKSRQRVYHFSLPDPQKNSVLAKRIADIQADEFSYETYSGTLQASFVYDGAGNQVSATMVRAGDEIVVEDWPWGSDAPAIRTGRIFRCYGTHKTERDVTFDIGRLPTRIDQLIAQDHRRLMRTGHISSSPV